MKRNIMSPLESEYDSCSESDSDSRNESEHNLPTVQEADTDGKWREKFTILQLATKLASVWQGFGGGFSTKKQDILNSPVQRENIDSDMPWINCRSRPLEPYFSVRKDETGDFHIHYIYGNLGAVSATVKSNGKVIQGPIS